MFMRKVMIFTAQFLGWLILPKEQILITKFKCSYMTLPRSMFNLFQHSKFLN